MGNLPIAQTEKTAYLDHAATTPLSVAAQNAWVETVEALRTKPGNPSSLHSGGRFAARLVQDAREKIAACLGAEKSEIIFVSGATESDALGVLGAARAVRQKDPERSKIVVSAVEHDSVAEQETLAVSDGFDWLRLPVSFDGRSIIDEGLAGPHQLALASISMVSAETGIIQPVQELVEHLDGRTLVHTDAAQAVGSVPVDFGQLGADLLSFGGHKIGAPGGIGGLIVRRDVQVASDRRGGGQERKIRSGTVDVAGAVSLATAVEEVTSNLQARVRHFEKLRNHLSQNLPEGVSLTSDAPSSPAVAHLTAGTRHPEILLLVMDQNGVMVSAGSACHAGVTRPSEILLRMGRSEEGALGVLRVSFGPENTLADVDRFLGALPSALEAARRLDEFDRR